MTPDLELEFLAVSLRPRSTAGGFVFGGGGGPRGTGGRGRLYPGATETKPEET